MMPGTAASNRDHVLLITIDDLNDWTTYLSDKESGRGISC
jgi:hypothetical protein